MTAKPSTSIERQQWRQRSEAIRELATASRRIMLLVGVIFAASLQFLWDVYQRFGFEPSKFGSAILVASAAIALCPILPRQLRLPFWPVMTVLEGLTICAFVFLSQEPPLIFLMGLFACLPGIIGSQIALYLITRPHQ